MRKRMWFVLMMMALCALVAFAADVTGKWTAQVPGRNGTSEWTFNFKVDGETLTGTVTVPFGGGMEQEITEGKVSGDDISFATVFQGPNGEFRMNYKGKVKGDEIEFTREMPGGQFPASNFTAKKAE